MAVGFFSLLRVQLCLEGPAGDDVTAVIITLLIRRSKMAALSGALVVHSHASGCLPPTEPTSGKFPKT